jgi:hypothetical protein
MAVGRVGGVADVGGGNDDDALRQGRFKENLFQDCAGKPLDDLWRDFADSLSK